MHVPWAHYTISLVKECRFVVKGCRFASVREKCMCYIWVGNHHGHWYRFFIFNNRKIEVSLQIRGGRHETMPRRGKAPASAPAPAASGKKGARERGADDDGADDDNDDHPQQGPPTTTSIAEKRKKQALRMDPYLK